MIWQLMQLHEVIKAIKPIYAQGYTDIQHKDNDNDKNSEDSFIIICPAGHLFEEIGTKG